MTQEGPQQIIPMLDRPAGVARAGEQVLEIERSPIRQRSAFEIAPEPFDGIQFRRVGGKADGVDVGRTGQEGLDLPGAMSSEPIPQEHDRAPELAMQVAQEAPHLRRRDAAVRMETNIQRDPVPGWWHTEGRNEGDLLMAAGPLAQHGRVPLSTPSPSTQRSHQHARLIEKGQPGLQARGVCFTRGPVSLIHRRMASASRSTA